MTAITFENTKRGYGHLWDQATITNSTQATAVANKIRANRNLLEPVEQETDVPWWLVGAWLYRESSLDFDTVLANGQSLHHRTTEVPAGLGPFTSFLLGAVASIQYEHKAQNGHFYKMGRATWVLEYCLWATEAWNGKGYFKHGVNSPYLWAWTSLYRGGKFDRDGHYNPNLFDPQGGVVAILKALFAIEPSLMPARITTEKPMTDTTQGVAPNMTLPPINPTAGATAQQAQIANILHGLATVAGFLPIAANFFPPLKVAVPFVPLIQGALNLAQELESAPHDPKAISDIIMKHLANVQNDLAQIKSTLPLGQTSTGG